MLGVVAGVIADFSRSRAALVAENELLRQQFAVAKRRLESIDDKEKQAATHTQLSAQSRPRSVGHPHRRAATPRAGRCVLGGFGVSSGADARSHEADCVGRRSDIARCNVQRRSPELQVQIRRPLSSGSRTWTRTVTLNRTHVWDEVGLEPVVERAITPSRTYLDVFDRLRGARANELIVFDQNPLWVAGTPMLRLDPTSMFATGEGRSPESRPIDSLEHIRAARVIDHGGCSWITPWIAGPNVGNLYGPPTVETKGTFRILDDNIDKTIRAQVPKALVFVAKVLTAYQPSFTRHAGLSTFNTVDHDDGFAMHVEYSFILRNSPNNPGVFAVMKVDARYAIRHVKGLPFVTIVGQPRSSVIGSIFTAFLTTEILDDTFGNLVPAIMNKSIVDQASVVPVPFSRCDATPSAGGDASCSKPLNRKLLEDVLAKASDKKRAADVIAALKDESFVCRSLVAEDPSAGQCFWHPSFERVNVLPQGIEAVWENAAAPVSADREVVRILAPGLDHCDKTTGTNWSRLPTYVPKNYYGEEVCGGCIPLP